VRRLYSSFASGAPGFGLLLLRVTAGAALIAHACNHVDWVHVAAAAVGALVVAGLVTPIAGVLAAIAAAWIAIGEGAAQIGYWSFVAAIGIALALLGPGAWSVDARLFGWKRVDLRNRNSGEPPPD
jgi:hypothetical protein